MSLQGLRSVSKVAEWPGKGRTSQCEAAASLVLERRMPTRHWFAVALICCIAGASSPAAAIDWSDYVGTFGAAGLSALKSAGSGGKADARTEPFDGLLAIA